MSNLNNKNSIRTNNTSINTNNNNDEANAPNFYYKLAQEDESTKNLTDKILTNDEFSESSIFNDNLLFSFDENINKLKEQRLNETDKFYKFKKHYFLKDSYEKFKKLEDFKFEEQLYYEEKYLKNCKIAELKLKQRVKLDYDDIYYLSKRNYPLLEEVQKNTIIFNTKLHYSFKIAALMGTIVITSFINSCILFTNFGKKHKLFRYAISSSYFVAFYLSNLSLINSNIAKRLSVIFEEEKTKAKILNLKNEIYKTPYDKEEATYNVEKSEVSDLYLRI